MPWVATAGATFWLENGPGGEKHLYFVLNNPMPFPAYGENSCLVVNASTPGRFSDKTCMLPTGCHASITHESIAFFAKARVLQAPELEKNVNNRVYQPGAAADLKLIKYIVSFMHDAEQLDDEFKPFALRIELQLNAKP